MQCPLCITNDLTDEALADGPVMKSCSQCRGRFLTSNSYFDWLEAHGQNLPELPPDGTAFELQDTSDPHLAKRCPECGGILVPYKVGRSTSFALDRCFHCGGVWFDQNEWEILRARNLHDDIHLIFTKPWQEDVRLTELSKQREARLRQNFGNAEYDELIRIKHWLDSQPKSREMYSYLLNEARLLHTL